jgi:hypothetical protein
MVPSFYGVFVIAMAMVVYHDQKLNGRSGIGWALLVLATGPIGLVIYWIYNQDTIALAGSRMKKKNLIEKLGSNQPPRRDREDRSYLSAPPETLVVEASFSDPDLDALIRDGNISDARQHLDRILKLASDMGDTELASKYEAYAAKLN